MSRTSELDKQIDKLRSDLYYNVELINSAGDCDQSNEIKELWFLTKIAELELKLEKL